MPGHSIPYALSDSEIQSFLTRHPEIEIENLPPYGIIVQEAYGELLVWIDATGHLHVIDVTNLSVATEVKKAPFVSENDEGFWTNLFAQIETVSSQAAKTTMDILSMLSIIAVAVMVIYVFPRR